jgi:hypothetical protein
MKEWDAPESNKTVARVELTRNIPSTTLVLLGDFSINVHCFASCVALLSLVALRGLIPVPHLLHLLVLHWGVWRVPLRACIGIVTKLSTLEASSGCGIRRYHRSQQCADWSSLLTLLGKLGVESEG